MLDELDLMVIGSKAEALSKRLARRRAEHLHSIRVAGAQSLISRVNDPTEVPPEERRQWLQTYESEHHTDDVEGELITLADKEGRPFLGRGLSIEYRRVRGARPRIIKCVARWASWRFGRPITASMVERCWKKYRADFKNNLE